MAITIPEGPRVNQRALALPGAPRLADAGMGALAQGSRQAVDALADVQARMQLERDTTRIFEAEVALDNAYRKQEMQFKERRGTAAFGLQDDASQWWEAEPARIASELLENPQQQQQFQRAVQRRRSASLNALAAFEASERETARNQAATAAIATQVSLAAQNFDSPSMVAEARADILQKVEVQAYLNGWDTNVAKQARTDALTTMHTQVIQNMVDANPSAAQAYFDRVKDEIDGAAWDGLQKVVKVGNDLEAAQTLADDIWSRGLRGTQALDAVRKGAKGDVREKALTLIRSRQADVEQAKNTARRDAVNTALAAFNDGGLAALTPTMEQDLQTLAPDTLTALRNRAWTPQDKVATDWARFDELKTQIETGALADVQNMDFSGSLDKLNSAELATLQTLQQARLKGSPGNVATTEQVLAEAHRTMGWGSKDAEKRGLFDRRAREAIDAEQSVQGRELRDDEKRKIVDRLLVEGEIPRDFWFNRDARYFEVVGTDEEGAFVLDVPKDMRRSIETALRQRGEKVDAATVQRYYRQYLEWQEAQ